MNYARQQHTVSVLTNGNVLVAGYSITAELYNSSGSVWTITGNMSDVRTWSTVSILTNGIVLVAGGYDNINALNTAESYNPLLVNGRIRRSYG